MPIVLSRHSGVLTQSGADDTVGGKCFNVVCCPPVKESTDIGSAQMVTSFLGCTLPDSVSQMLSALFNTRVCLTQSPKHREHCLTQVSSVPILRVNGLVLNASNDKPANTTTLSTLSLLSSEVKGITTTMSKVSFKFNTRSSVSFSVNGK